VMLSTVYLIVLCHSLLSAWSIGSSYNE
jgi:hypothetical protein